MELSKRSQNFIILAVSIGGIIEWYELFLYVYWTPLISHLFFADDSSFVASMKTLFVFFIGFLARPVGGLLFGHIGDKQGRKASFIKSILWMTIPSFAMGLLPSVKMGIAAPIILCILRFFQGLPAGGELPGAMCYLAESTSSEKRRPFICSFSFLGPQIGVVIAMLECYLLEKHVSHDMLISYGWRISFILGGILGLIGFCIRRKLEESKPFRILENEGKTLRKPIIESLVKHKKDICFGFFASFLDVVGFYMFSIFLSIYFNKVLKISATDNLLLIALSMILSTITLPFIGMLGKRYKIKHLLIFSAVGIMLFSYPFYLAASIASILLTTLIQIILMLLLNIQFAILPCLISELFPTSTRYTGIGLSFNLCDSIIGGSIPLIALMLTQHIGDVATFLLLFTGSAMISLVTFMFIKEKRLKKINP